MSGFWRDGLLPVLQVWFPQPLIFNIIFMKQIPVCIINVNNGVLLQLTFIGIIYMNPDGVPLIAVLNTPSGFFFFPSCEIWIFSIWIISILHIEILNIKYYSLLLYLFFGSFFSLSFSLRCWEKAGRFLRRRGSNFSACRDVTAWIRSSGCLNFFVPGELLQFGKNHGRDSHPFVCVNILCFVNPDYVEIIT